MRTIDNPKHYNTACRPIYHVWFRTQDAADNCIINYQDNACFMPLIGSVIPQQVKRVVIYHEKTRVPYSFETIQRWIADINELGFPCSVVEKETTYEFETRLDQYRYKAHLVSTWMLIRALYEVLLCWTTELYFELLDKGATDKFQALQTAHKQLIELQQASGYNNNHTITYHANGKNVSKEQLWGNYEKCGFGVYDLHIKPGETWSSKIVTQHDKWNGGRI